MQVKPSTALEYFYKWESIKPNAIYLRQPSGQTFKNYTWEEVSKQARQMAAHLQESLPPQSKVGIISKNCAHWIICDLAIMMAGHISVPFYPTLNAEQLNQVLTHSECALLFVGKLDKGINFYTGIPKSVKVYSFPEEYENSPVQRYESWSDIIKKYLPITGTYLPQLSDLMSIVYTSGTTVIPKGVMIHFANNAAFIETVGETVGILGAADARFFSYLPLCHIAERSMVETGSLISGGTVYFAESLDTFAHNLQAAQPTHFFAVPRIWTRFQMGILSKLPQPKLTQLLKLPIISAFIKNKIKKGLGLDKAKFILTAAAPMPVELIKWFRQLDIFIQEAYGMTENMGVHTLIMPNDSTLGTVGKPFAKVQTRIDPNSAEIQVKSPTNTTGYYKEPHLTNELFSDDGWLCTGDMGTLTPEGYLQITGRVKDIFKTQKGQYVSPSPIEFEFSTNIFIEQICVMGTSLPQPIALIVLSDLGKAASPNAIENSIQDILDKKIQLKFRQYEQLKKVVIVQNEWTIDNNLLTPTLKIKRNKIEEAYSNKIDQWYQHEKTVIWE